MTAEGISRTDVPFVVPFPSQVDPDLAGARDRNLDWAVPVRRDGRGGADVDRYLDNLDAYDPASGTVDLRLEDA